MKRNDIPALRGFAVLAVLLYHLQIPLFKGGFLGVDIFFVISGFVITERLARGEGSISTQLLDFYKRRAKRILPASLFVIALTAVAVRIFLSPLSWHRFGLDGIATTFFAGNLRFAVQGNDYLSQSMSPTPYLHYWSLGVEEQFYLIWPLLFLFFFRSRKNLLLPFAFLATIFAFWYTQRSPVDSFYQPFSRAWEFLAGIIVALLIPKRVGPSKLLAISGWFAISFSVFCIGSDLPVPGVTTLVPICGAVAVLSAQVKMPWEAILAKVGDYSFAIYLIHWPLVVVALSRYQGLNVTSKVVIAFLSVTGGYGISRYIENPFRFNKKFSLSFRSWGAGILAVAVLAFGITNFASANATRLNAQIDLSKPIIYSDHCHLDFGISQPKAPCLFGDLTSKNEVILVGDSHAAQWFNAVEESALAQRWKLLSLTKSSCPAAFLPIKRNGVLDSSCASWQRYVAKRIKAEQPLKVFITGFSEYKYSLNQRGDYATVYAKGLTEFISALGLPSTSIYYIEDTPRPTVSIPDCLAKNTQKKSSCDFLLQRSAATLAIKTATHPLLVHYLDFTKELCLSNTCSAIFAGHNAYRDDSHLSVSASKALAPYFTMLATQ